MVLMPSVWCGVVWCGDVALVANGAIVSKPAKGLLDGWKHVWQTLSGVVLLFCGEAQTSVCECVCVLCVDCVGTKKTGKPERR